MKNLAIAALGVALGCSAIWLCIHRNVVRSYINGDPIPEPPAWHNHCHKCG